MTIPQFRKRTAQIRRLTRQVPARKMATGRPSSEGVPVDSLVIVRVAFGDCRSEQEPGWKAMHKSLRPGPQVPLTGSWAAGFVEGDSCKWVGMGEPLANCKRVVAGVRRIADLAPGGLRTGASVR